MTESISRRPIASRDRSWAKRSACWLKDIGIRPNMISVASTLFAGIAAVFLFKSASSDAVAEPFFRGLLLSGVVLGILGRLICNLLDGMVALEGGLKTPSGEVFNDLPDRLSDFLIFVAMGFAATTRQGFYSTLWIQAGWAAGTLAVLTAYIRYLGAACGAGHFFIGPMAKQHRMAVSIVASVSSILFEPLVFSVGTSFEIALGIVVIGSAMTCFRRTLFIVRYLESSK